MRTKEILGIVNVGNKGLRWKRIKCYNNSNKKDMRDLIIKVVREKEEESRLIHVDTLAKQGDSTRWEDPRIAPKS